VTNFYQFSFKLNTAIWGEKNGSLLFFPPEIYEQLEKNSLVATEKAIKLFSNHTGIGLPELQFWQGDDFAGVRKIGHYSNGKIILKRNSSINGKSFAKILAHEFAHFYLDKKKLIIDDAVIDSDESLVDKTVFFLGMGHLNINGDPHIGYLDVNTCLFNYYGFGFMNGIPDELLFSYLDDKRYRKNIFTGKKEKNWWLRG